MFIALDATGNGAVSLTSFSVNYGTERLTGLIVQQATALNLIMASYRSRVEERCRFSTGALYGYCTADLIFPSELLISPPSFTSSDSGYICIFTPLYPLGKLTSFPLTCPSFCLLSQTGLMSVPPAVPVIPALLGAHVQGLQSTRGP